MKNRRVETVVEEGETTFKKKDKVKDTKTKYRGNINNRRNGRRRKGRRK
jgi:hypothetical protein